jgi:hypothetical protein
MANPDKSLPVIVRKNCRNPAFPRQYLIEAGRRQQQAAGTGINLMHKVIEELRTVLLRDGAGLGDGQLLERFTSNREEAAFTALVRRHGPMVLGVCLRVLRNHHDSEDAFQATFLVLARKAASIRPPEMVGNWLYGVAYVTPALPFGARLNERSFCAIRLSGEQYHAASQPAAFSHGDLRKRDRPYHLLAVPSSKAL